MSAAARTVVARAVARSYRDAGHAALLKWRTGVRFDWSQARVPKGSPGGGRFTSGGSGGGGRGAPAVRLTPEQKQAKAIAYLQQSLEKRAARSARAKERAQQTLLFKRAPKKSAPEGGYTLNKAFTDASGAKAVAGIKNKAMVHEKGVQALAEHKARKARTGRTVPPPAAAAAAPPPASHVAPAMRQQPRIHGDKTEGQLATELRMRIRDAAADADAVGRAKQGLQAAEKRGATHAEITEHQRRVTEHSELHDTSKTRLREVENEIAHREATAAPVKTAAHSEAEQRLARAQSELEKIDRTGYGAANRRYVEQDISRARNEVNDHERIAAGGAPQSPGFHFAAGPAPSGPAPSLPTRQEIKRAEREHQQAADKEKAAADARNAADEARAARERSGEGDTLGRIMAEARSRPASLGTYEEEVQKTKDRSQAVADRENAKPISRALTPDEKERARKLTDAIEVLSSSERQHRESQSDGGRAAMEKVVRAARSRVENLHLGLEPGVYAKHAAQSERSAKAKATKAANAKSAQESGYVKSWRSLGAQDAWDRAKR